MTPTTAQVIARAREVRASIMSSLPRHDASRYVPTIYGRIRIATRPNHYVEVDLTVEPPIVSEERAV